MVPTFTLPAGYTGRFMRLVLTRASNGKGWKFMGEADGYAVPARRASGLDLSEGMVFPSRKRAAEFAYTYSLPAYATWNGRTRAYVGHAFTAWAEPRKEAA